MPDLSGAEGVRSLFHLPDEPRDLAPRALKVRRAGTELITLAGGQFIHPIKAIVGGVSAGIPADAASEMATRLRETLPLARDLFDRYWKLFMGLRDRIGTLGDDAPTHYLAAVEPGHAYYGDVIHVMEPDGSRETVFSAPEYRNHLALVPTETSYSNATLFEDEIMRANSLARLNMLPELGTPMADDLMARFRREWGHPAHAILLFDLARGIELVYAIERAITILGQNLEQGDLALPYEVRDGEGYGLVEAPRGPLIHHYEIENGLVRDAQFIIPTQHNILAIERALLVAARRYIAADGISLELERAVGRVVRAFDPCIACATH